MTLLEETERKTADGRSCISGWRSIIRRAEAILDAVRARVISRETITEESFPRTLGPDVDLLIRTSGEQRLSDFLLWECAYAEMIFTAACGLIFRRRIWRLRSRNSTGAIAGSERQFHGRAADGLSRLSSPPWIIGRNRGQPGYGRGSLFHDDRC